jgi:hypothetical protein
VEKRKILPLPEIEPWPSGLEPVAIPDLVVVAADLVVYAMSGFCEHDSVRYGFIKC